MLNRFRTLLGDFLEWWLAGLRAWIPAGIARRFSQESAPVLLHWDESEVRIDADISTRSAAIPPAIDFATPDFHAWLAHYRGDSKSVELRVPEAYALRKTIALPVAARTNIREALTYELERHIPFALSDIYWTHAVRDNGSRHQPMKIDVVIVPNATLGPLLAALRQCDIEAIKLSIGEQAVPSIDIPLFADDDAVARYPTGLRVRWATVLALGALALFLPYYDLKQDTEHFSDRFNDQKDEGKVVAAKYRNAESFVERWNRIAEERSTTIAISTLMRELDRHLDGVAEITRLEVNRHTIVVHGMSPYPAVLPSKLLQSDYFRDVSFSSARRNRSAGSGQRFTLSIKLKTNGNGEA